MAQTGKPLAKRLACFTVADPSVILLGRETIFRDGRQVGWLTSGGWGYTVDRNIGFGYIRRAEGVPTDWLKNGRYELEVASQRVGAEIHLAPLYDPEMTRIKA